MSPYIRRLRRAVGHDLLLTPAACAIIHNEQGQVLLMKRRDDGNWDPPGGHIDPGETPAAAAEREALEEAGLRVRADRIVGVLGGLEFAHRYPNGDQTQPLIVCFACNVTGGALEATDGEAAELRYFSQDELPTLSTRYPLAVLFPAASGPAYFQAMP